MSDTEKKYEEHKNESHRIHEDSITSNVGEVPEKIPDFTPDNDYYSQRSSENDE